MLQIVIWFIIPALRNHRTNQNNNALALIVLFQYIPRLYLIFPLSSQIIKATGVVTKTAWAGAAYNLLLYMLASHVCNFYFLIYNFRACEFCYFINYYDMLVIFTWGLVIVILLLKECYSFSQIELYSTVIGLGCSLVCTLC